MEPQEWQDLLSHSRDWALEDEVSSGPELAAEWLDEQERASEQLLRNIRSGPTMLPEMCDGSIIPNQTQLSQFPKMSQPTPWNLAQEFDISAKEGVPALPTPMELVEAPAAKKKLPMKLTEKPPVTTWQNNMHTYRLYWLILRLIL